MGVGSRVELESSSKDPRRAAIAEVRLQFRGTGVRTLDISTWNLVLRFAHLFCFIKRVMTRVVADGYTDLPAQMSFILVLSLVPFFLVLDSFVGWLPTTSLWEQLVRWITTYLPQASCRVIFTFLDLTHEYTTFLSIGLLAMIWSASSGFVSLMEAFSIAYGVKVSRSTLKKRLIAIVATLATAIFFLLTFALIAIGHTAVAFVTNQYSAFVVSKVPWDTIRWITNLFASFIGISLINYFLPDVKRAWRRITPGTSFVTLAFFLASIAVDFYVQHASNIPKVYGTLAGFIIIILMIWIYIANLILLGGAEINAALEELTDAGASR